jgi:hypothetical protein
MPSAVESEMTRELELLQVRSANAGSFEGSALLDEKGSPATVATNDPRYSGFVIGAALPAAAAAQNCTSRKLAGRGYREKPARVLLPFFADKIEGRRIAVPQ